MALDALAKADVAEAPLLWRYEFAQVIGAEVRNRRMLLPAATEAYNTALQFLTSEIEVEPGSKYLETSVRLNISSYDAVWAYHADRSGSRIITFDARLVRAIPHLATSPEAYLAE